MSGGFDTVGGAPVGNVIEVHLENLIFAVENLGGDGKNSLFDFAGDCALGSQECYFDELLSNSASSLETLSGEGFPERADEPTCVKTVMLVEIFVFYCDCGLFEVLG